MPLHQSHKTNRVTFPLIGLGYLLCTTNDHARTREAEACMVRGPVSKSGSRTAQTLPRDSDGPLTSRSLAIHLTTAQARRLGPSCLALARLGRRLVRDRSTHPITAVC